MQKWNDWFTVNIVSQFGNILENETKPREVANVRGMSKQDNENKMKQPIRSEKSAKIRNQSTNIIPTLKANETSSKRIIKVNKG